MSKEQLSNEVLENEIKVLEAKSRRRKLIEEEVRALDELFTTEFICSKGLYRDGGNEPKTEYEYKDSIRSVKAKLHFLLQNGVDPFVNYMDVHNMVYKISNKLVLSKRLIPYIFSKKGGVLKILERTPQVCRVHAFAYVNGEKVEHTVEKRIHEFNHKVTEKDNKSFAWKKHPDTMLSYQCFAEVKKLFSFLWEGVCYTDDEFEDEELGVNQEDLKYDCLKNSESNLISIDNFRQAREVENEKPFPKQYDSNQQIIKEGLEGLSRLK